MITMTDMNNVRYMVDNHGKPTAAVIDIQLWESLLEWLEDEADLRLAKERLAGWQTAVEQYRRDRSGWVTLEDLEAELQLEAENPPQA